MTCVRMAKLHVGQLVSEQRPQARPIDSSQGAPSHDDFDATRRMRNHGYADGVRIEHAVESGAPIDGAPPQPGCGQKRLQNP